MTAVVLRGDARRLPLPDGCVDLIVTSPPYFSLRSYTDDGAHYAGQIGSEASPREWLDALLACTRDWIRVLKPSGSLFVNLGDKFSTGNSGESGMAELGKRWAGGGHSDAKAKRRSAAVEGLPPKTLLGLPWRYALACMDDLGLILRRDIIWSKPNGLPESVTDRCRSSHEYLFHFTRQPRYYAAVDEIREPTGGAHDGGLRHLQGGRRSINPDGSSAGGNTSGCNPLGKLPGSVWDIPSQPLTVPAALGVDHFAAFPMELPRRCVLGWSPPGVCTACGEGRRPVTAVTHRSVDHDGRDPNAMRAAGKALLTGRNRQTNRWGDGALATITGYACACTPYTDYPGTGEVTTRRAYSPGMRDDNAQGTYGRKQAGEYERVGPRREYHLEDWTPPPTRPALVLDPFGGTGTTALVAAAYGRTGISVDMSGDYSRLARWRCSDPAERAKAMMVAKPPPVPDGQVSLFDMEAS